MPSDLQAAALVHGDKTGTTAFLLHFEKTQEDRNSRRIGQSSSDNNQVSRRYTKLVRSCFDSDQVGRKYTNSDQTRSDSDQDGKGCTRCGHSSLQRDPLGRACRNVHLHPSDNNLERRNVWLQRELYKTKANLKIILLLFRLNTDLPGTEYTMFVLSRSGMCQKDTTDRSVSCFDTHQLDRVCIPKLNCF